jgi:hypothetical protein
MRTSSSLSQESLRKHNSVHSNCLALHEHLCDKSLGSIHFHRTCIWHVCMIYDLWFILCLNLFNWYIMFLLENSLVETMMLSSFPCSVPKELYYSWKSDEFNPSNRWCLLWKGCCQYKNKNTMVLFLRKGETYNHSNCLVCLQQHLRELLLETVPDSIEHSSCAGWEDV